MARHNQRKVINAISIENTAIGEYLTGDDGDQFRKFPSNVQAPPLPTRTPVPDEMIGSGSPYPQHSQPYYYDPINKPYAGILTDTFGARLLRMFLGGALTETENALPGTSDWAIVQLAPGLPPMVCNQIRSNGGAKFLYGDVFVQTLEITQTGAGQPQVSAQFSNGGHHIAIADTTIDLADVDAMDTYLKFDGKKTKLTFSDGVDSYDFAAEKRLIDVSFTGNQNVLVEQLPGDSPLVASAECAGGFTQNLNIDVQDGMMRVKVYMDDSFAQFASWKANRKLTSVILKFSSCETIGLTTHKAELEIKFPIAEFNLTGDTQGNFDAYSFEIRAIEGDPVSGSLILGRVRKVGDLDEAAP